MADSSTLQELLSRWEKEGRPPPELFCRDTPDQLEAFKNAIEELQSMESFLASNDNTIDHTHSADQASADPNLISTKPKSDSQSESPSAMHTGSDTSAIEKSEHFLGRYQLRRRIGKGGFGEVWEAYHPDLKKTVAIKKPRGDERVAAQHVECFLSEAQKAAQLRHSAIVPVLDVVRDGDSWFIVSELIDGTNLKEHMANNRLPVERVVQIVAAIAEALHAAHRKRLIHRDVKPGNILIDRQGQPYLTDFGLSLSEEDQQSEKGYIVGTLAYMSPEQVQGDNHLLDGRSDIFSLGVVLYELLTGERPFKGKTKVEVREQILVREPKPPRAINESIPRELERVCLKCLNKSIGARYATGADLAAELRGSLHPRKRRRGLILAAGILAATVILLACAYHFSNGFRLGQFNSSSAIGKGNTDGQLDGKMQLNLTLDGFQPLWIEPPEILASPPGSLIERKKQSVWIVIKRGNAFAKLGEVTAPSYTLRTRIEPNSAKGVIAIFLGLQPRNQSKNEFQFQTIQFSPSQGQNGEPKLEISRWFIPSYNFMAGGFPTAQMAEHEIADQPLTEGGQVEISVVDHQLADVQWNGKKLAKLTNSIANGRFSAKSYQGGFGFFVSAASVRYYQPRIKLKHK